MYALLRPGTRRIERLLDKGSRRALSTPTDPLTAQPDARWNVDHYEVTVTPPAGAAPATVRSTAADIITDLAFFPEWMVVAKRGDTVLIGARVLGVVGVFANRILERRNESDDAHGSFAVGFTYATTQGHFAIGVETFLARRADASGPVVFTIDATSRPGEHLWKRVVAPVVLRPMQRHFGRDAPPRFARLLTERLSARTT
jgi:uncharacterized protein (UPF0548 family)